MANAWLCCYVQCEIVCSTVCRMIRWMYQMISNSYRCLIFYAWSTANKSKTVAIRFASTLTLLASASAKIKHVIHVVLLEKRCWTTHWTKSREIIPTQATLVAQWCHQSWAQCHFSSNTASLRTFRTLLKAYLCPHLLWHEPKHNKTRLISV